MLNIKDGPGSGLACEWALWTPPTSRMSYHPNQQGRRRSRHPWTPSWCWILPQKLLWRRLLTTLPVPLLSRTLHSATTPSPSQDQLPMSRASVSSHQALPLNQIPDLTNQRVFSLQVCWSFWKERFLDYASFLPIPDSCCCSFPNWALLSLQRVSGRAV